MEDFVERVVRRLRDGSGLSRNRHFLTFASPEGRKALRIHRHLRSVERDLARAVRAEVDRGGERVRIDIRTGAGSRSAWLTQAEFRLLCESEAVRAVLRCDA